MNNKIINSEESNENNLPIEELVLAEIKKNFPKKLENNIDISTEFSTTGIDSIEFFEIAVKLEKIFNFEFDDDKIVYGTFNNVLSMSQYIKERINLRKIEDTILNIIKKSLNEESASNIDYQLSFLDAGINSIKFIELVVKIEEIFNITFEDDKLIFGKLNNINMMAEYIMTLTSENNK